MGAIDFIKVSSNDTNATRASALVSAARALREAYEQLGYVLDNMNHLHDGTDFSQIETFYGLEAGNGQVEFNLINGAKGSMDGMFQVADARDLTVRIV